MIFGCTITVLLKDSFDLALTGFNWPTILVPNVSSVDNLQPGESVDLSLQVQVPAGVLLGSSDTVALSAASVSDPSRSDAITLTTRVPLHRLFLPEVEK